MSFEINHQSFRTIQNVHFRSINVFMIFMIFIILCFLIIFIMIIVQIFFLLTRFSLFVTFFLHYSRSWSESGRYTALRCDKIYGIPAISWEGRCRVVYVYSAKGWWLQTLCGLAILLIGAPWRRKRTRWNGWRSFEWWNDTFDPEVFVVERSLRTCPMRSCDA